MRHMTAVELSAHLQTASTRPLLLDVREPWEYQLASLPDSVLIPIQQIPARVAELDRERETVVICHHGVRSWYVGAFLERQGLTNVINLTGGVDAWSTDVDTAVPRY
jgi:rhodanese-related sulfurtransferase